MDFIDLIDRLHAHIVHRSAGFPGGPVLHVVASDLMSDILVTDYDDVVILTSLASEQSVRTADMINARGVILVNDKVPQPSMKALAIEQDITLLSTPMPMFEACVSLGGLLGAARAIRAGKPG